MANPRPRSAETHPWLTFRLDLQATSPRCWMLLGEIRSKIDHLRRVPLPPAIWEDLRVVSLVKGVQATTAIEGNTLTEEQVRKIYERTLTLPPSREYLAREVQNVLAAINNVEANVQVDPEMPITRAEIMAMNGMILDGLDLDDVVPGERRKGDVVVADYVGPAANECDELLDRLCVLLNTHVHTEPQGEWKFPVAVLKAIYAHLYIAWIHPFGDGNGRTARLLELRILRSAGVPDVAAHLLANHYNETRTAYYRALSRASKDRDHGVAAFVEYAIEGLRDGLQTAIDRVLDVVTGVMYRDFVFQSFGKVSGITDRRRRDLALHLGTFHRNGASEVELLHAGSVGEFLYRDKTRATLRRDLRFLQDVGLVRRQGDRHFAALSLMDVFRPMVAGA